MKNYIAVVDETGNSNRPGLSDDSSFGVAAILFPSSISMALAQISKSIGVAVGKADFKYKHVRESAAARQQFLAAVNGFNDQIYLYAFYAHGACVTNEMKLTEQAAIRYEREYSSSKRSHLETFVQYMAANMAAHAASNKYDLSVYWDRRTDLGLIKDAFNTHVALQAETLRYRDVNRRVQFIGQATAELLPITRLAGIVAGDVWKYFAANGQRIWRHFDQEGLLGSHDPHVNIDDPNAVGLICVAEIYQKLTNDNPYIPSESTVMLQGYYKRFLTSESAEHLISFGDPGGHLGILGIVRGNYLKIYQLPD